jgi:hypothetical protein
MLFNKLSVALLYVLLFAALLVATSCSKYNVHASSESITPNPEDLEIVEIFEENKPIPLNEWKKAIESRDYKLTPVASEEVRKRYSDQ